MNAVNVLYEDNHLLVVVKPPNLPAQADASGDDDLLSQCKRYIGEKYHKPGAVYLGLVHRLDRPAGGVMVFARTSKAAERLSAQFRGHGTQKRYAALISGESAPQASLKDAILRDESGARVVPPATPGAKPASLAYTRVQTQGALTLLDVRLFTGRHHQIRVQLAAHGLPLWGDQRYNPDAVPGQQLALWAYSLTLEHPTLHTPMTFTALPAGGAWTPFARALEALSLGFRLAYEDENLLAAIKPAGMETCMADAAQRAGESLEARLGTLGPVYPVHRLDVNTTGLVLFAKTAEAERALGEAIQKREIGKFYHCLVRGEPHPPQGTLRAYLRKDERAARVSVSDAPAPDAKPIETGYRVLQAYPNGACLLEVELLSGRTHQIRAHLAHIGHPILGDDKYGDREWNRQNRVSLPRLSAVRLAFHLPPENPLRYMNAVTLQTQAPWLEEESDADL